MYICRIASGDVQKFRHFYAVSLLANQMQSPNTIYTSSDHWSVPRRNRAFRQITSSSQGIIVCRISGRFSYSAMFSFPGALRLVSTSPSILLFIARTATSSKSRARSVTPRKAGSRCAPNSNSTIRKLSFPCVAGTRKCSVSIATRILISATPQ